MMKQISRVLLEKDNWEKGGKEKRSFVPSIFACSSWVASHSSVHLTEHFAVLETQNLEIDDIYLG